MRRRAWAVAVAVSAALAAPAWALNKCQVDGRIVYQDLPCPEARETVAQGLARQQRVEAWHRKLDQMAARGVGLVQRAPVPPPPPPKAEDETPPRLRRMSQAEHDAVSARLSAQTAAKNERSRVALIETLDAMQAKCPGKLPDLPSVGMRDEFFRNCTLHARFGGAQQVVAFEEDGVQLRLYVFPPGSASRVYSVDGVITAVRP